MCYMVLLFTTNIKQVVIKCKSCLALKRFAVFIIFHSQILIQLYKVAALFCYRNAKKLNVEFQLINAQCWVTQTLLRGFGIHHSLSLPLPFPLWLGDSPAFPPFCQLTSLGYLRSRLLSNFQIFKFSNYRKWHTM